MELDFKNCTGNREFLYRISGNSAEKEYSTRQCPDGIQLDIGHSKCKQSKYNSAYSIGFVVYTCLRNVMENAMLCAMVNNLSATVDARWRCMAWRTVKCGNLAATRIEIV
ncbi:hypothetical protein TIFTF001_051609, partial [Ficus carica]